MTHTYQDTDYWVHDLNPFIVQFSDNWGIRWYGFAYVMGFLAAFVFDEFMVTTNENPAIYPGCILLFGGLAQIWFYKLYKPK